jgi:hypothetical protein
MDCSTIDVSVVPVPQGKDILGGLLRQGAQQLLAQAIEAEVTEWIEKHAHLRDEGGHRHVVRNGSLPARTITTGVGPVEVKQPRVHDRRSPAEREKFTSAILPPYLRKTKSIEDESSSHFTSCHALSFWQGAAITCFRFDSPSCARSAWIG